MDIHTPRAVEWLPLLCGSEEAGNGASVTVDANAVRLLPLLVRSGNEEVNDNGYHWCDDCTNESTKSYQDYARGSGHAVEEYLPNDCCHCHEGKSSRTPQHLARHGAESDSVVQRQWAHFYFEHGNERDDERDHSPGGHGYEHDVGKEDLHDLLLSWNGAGTTEPLNEAVLTY